jgi:catalase
MPAKKSRGKPPGRANPKDKGQAGSDKAVGTTVSGAPPKSGSPVGPHEPMPSPSTGAGTLSEKNASRKTRPATFEPRSLDGSLHSKRVNSTDQVLATNQGVPVANNQDSLKAGLRGPTLLEDFILREKIAHFDHERILERARPIRDCWLRGMRGAARMRSPSSRRSDFTGTLSAIAIRRSSEPGLFVGIPHMGEMLCPSSIR